MYAGDLVNFGESENSLKELIEEFVRMCKTRALKINIEKNNGKWLLSEII